MMARSALLNRNIVHISMAGFALLIGRIPPWAVVALCIAALFFNIAVLPVISKRSLEKPEDRQRGYSTGLLTYPAVLAAISVLFYHNQVFLAVGWGMMAFGDGFASLTGRSAGRHKWKGGVKSVEGSLAFVIAATLLTMGLLALLPSSSTEILSWGQWWMLILVVSAITAILELIPGLFDDNLVVPLSGSVLASLVARIMQEGALSWPELWWIGPSAAIVFGIAALFSGAIDLRGALTGVILAVSIWLGAGLEGMLLLLIFFMTGSIAGFTRKTAKAATGLEAFRSPKRGWRNALSNAGAASFLALLAWLLPGDRLVFTVAMAAALASACSDTLSSELGTPYGKWFYDLKTLRRTIPGDDGVISFIGLAAGILGAILIALPAALLWREANVLLIIAVAGLSGNLADSVFGAWLQRSGFMNNHTVNAVSTLVAALVASLLFLHL